MTSLQKYNERQSQKFLFKLQWKSLTDVILYSLMLQLVALFLATLLQDNFYISYNEQFIFRGTWQSSYILFTLFGLLSAFAIGKALMRQQKNPFVMTKRLNQHVNQKILITISFVLTAVITLEQYVVALLCLMQSYDVIFNERLLILYALCCFITLFLAMQVGIYMALIEERALLKEKMLFLVSIVVLFLISAYFLGNKYFITLALVSLCGLYSWIRTKKLQKRGELR